MTLPSKRQLEKEQQMAQRLVLDARELYGDIAVDAALNHEAYYLIPPDMIWVKCPICETNMPIDCILWHITQHRGSYRCEEYPCFISDRRFKTYRGFRQHVRLAHKIDL